ncbi:hypothetical protein PCE1_003349 [Barthelona sp. PCE]
MYLTDIRLQAIKSKLNIESDFDLLLCSREQLIDVASSVCQNPRELVEELLVGFAPVETEIPYNRELFQRELVCSATINNTLEFIELLQPGTITEIYGEAGSGKTQVICQSLCYTILRQRSSAVYLCNESTAYTKRLQGMLKGLQSRGIIQNSLLKYQQVLHYTDETEDALNYFWWFVFRELPQILKRESICFLAIDSIFGFFQELTEQRDYIQRSEKLNHAFAELKKLAVIHRFPIVVANHVVTNFKTNTLVPALGFNYRYLPDAQVELTVTDVEKGRLRSIYNRRFGILDPNIRYTLLIDTHAVSIVAPC